jgi:lipocalin-like protein
MVTIKNSIKTVAIPLAVTSFMILQGCKKDEEEKVSAKTNLLIGDWKLTEVNGYNYSSPDYSLLFKFKSGAAFQQCYEYTSTPADNYCYDGNWKWKDSNENSLLITVVDDDGSDEVFDMDVVVLTATALEGKVDIDTYSSTVKFVKVN